MHTIDVSVKIHRMAKGRFGGDIFKDLMRVEVRIPTRIALTIDTDKISKYVGNRLAQKIRKRLRSGMDGDGGALNRPKRGSHPPMKETGRLIRSIRYQRRLGRVEPDSLRTRSDVGRGLKSNFSLMAVHIAKGHFRDPMGSLSKVQVDQISEWVNEVVAKEMRAGRAGLRAQYRRFKKRL